MVTQLHDKMSVVVGTNGRRQLQFDHKSWSNYVPSPVDTEWRTLGSAEYLRINQLLLWEMP